MTAQQSTHSADTKREERATTRAAAAKCTKGGSGHRGACLRQPFSGFRKALCAAFRSLGSRKWLDRLGQAMKDPDPLGLGHLRRAKRLGEQESSPLGRSWRERRWVCGAHLVETHGSAFSEIGQRPAIDRRAGGEHRLHSQDGSNQHTAGAAQFESMAAHLNVEAREAELQVARVEQVERSCLEVLGRHESSWSGISSASRGRALGTARATAVVVAANEITACGLPSRESCDHM